VTPEIQEMLRQMGKAAIRAFFAQARDVTAEHQHQRVGLAALREMIPTTWEAGQCNPDCIFLRAPDVRSQCRLGWSVPWQSMGCKPGPDCPAEKVKEDGA